MNIKQMSRREWLEHTVPAAVGLAAVGPSRRRPVAKLELGTSGGDN